jgi:hypothetical protein
MTTLASIVLQTAIAVMTFINANPSLPQWQHDQGISIAQQALQFANQSAGQPGYTTNTCNGSVNCNYQNCTTNAYGYQNCPLTTTNNFTVTNCNGYNCGSANCAYPYNNCVSNTCNGSANCNYQNCTTNAYGYQNCPLTTTNFTTANCNGYNCGSANCAYPYNNCVSTNTCNGSVNCNYQNCTTNAYGYQNCPLTTTNNFTAANVQILVLGAENVSTSFVQNGHTYSIIWSPFDGSQGYATVQIANSATGLLSTIGTMNGNTLTWVPSVASGNYVIRVLQQGAIIGSQTITVQ